MLHREEIEVGLAYRGFRAAAPQQFCFSRVDSDKSAFRVLEVNTVWDTIHECLEQGLFVRQRFLRVFEFCDIDTDRERAGRLASVVAQPLRIPQNPPLLSIFGHQWPHLVHEGTVGQGLAKQLPTCAAFRFRREDIEPVFPANFVQAVTGNGTQVGVGLVDPPLRVQNDDQRSGRLEQRLEEIPFATQIGSCFVEFSLQFSGMNDDASGQWAEDQNHNDRTEEHQQADEDSDWMHLLADRCVHFCGVLAYGDAPTGPHDGP